MRKFSPLAFLLALIVFQMPAFATDAIPDDALIEDIPLGARYMAARSLDLKASVSITKKVSL